jgi:hypothetical protein
MSTSPVAERIEQSRLHTLQEQRGELACDHARTHREELLGYIDMLTRDLEDKTDEYNTLRKQYDGQLELCADHSMEIVGLQVRAEDEAEALAATDRVITRQHAAVRAELIGIRGWVKHVPVDGSDLFVLLDCLNYEVRIPADGLEKIDDGAVAR